MRKRTPLVIRFWAQTNKREPNQCWLWVGATDNDGYGRMGGGGRGKHLRAHRVSWELHNGKINKGKFILHKCDNPTCVNPKHLFVGTPKDNSEDMVTKKRQAKGEANGSSRFTGAQIIAIRADTRLQKIIAIDYSTNQAHISAIKTRRVWRHI